MENVIVKKTFFFIAFLHLLLASPSQAGEAEFGMFVIDPGHGGYDTGIRTPSFTEKEITLELARQVKDILQELDREVILTRKIDHYQSIEQRRTIANRSFPDVFVSIHLSDSDTFSVYTAWYEKKDTELSLKEYYAISSRQRRYLYESGMLSADLADAVKEVTGTRVHRREMPLPLLSSIGAPAVLVEVPSEGFNYETDMLKMASSIVLGLLRYEESR